MERQARILRLSTPHVLYLFSQGKIEHKLKFAQETTCAPKAVHYLSIGTGTDMAGGHVGQESCSLGYSAPTLPSDATYAFSEWILATGGGRGGHLT
jgi:hypothetical protein